MRIFEESNPDWFYMNLHMFKKGIIDKRRLMEEDIIYDIRDNGIVILRFDDNSDYFKLFDLDEYNINTLSHIFSYYGYHEYFDPYAANQDFDEGYVLNYFNNENMELLAEIMKVFSPGLDVTERNNDRKIADILRTTFERQVSTIIDEYHSQVESAMTSAIEKNVKEEFCNIFEDDKIYNNDSCFYKYYTTIDNLINLYDHLNGKSLPPYEMLKKLGHTKSVGEDYGNAYDLDYFKYFDLEEFNRVTKSNLEDMLENIYDSDRFVDIEEYKRIIEKLSKFTFGKWYNLPKNKNKMFKIIEIDPETNHIVFEYKKKMTQDIEKGSVSYERFNLFLYHPELF